MSIALVEGSVFAGRYQILRCIAAGGMGAVYEVIHLETERRRALKVMLPHMVQSAELRDRFKREARVAANVESDFIVDVFDAGVDEATQMPFLVMELLKGEELGKRLERLGRLPPPEVVTYLHQTALALDKTHRASIVHRDLKPENLFLTEREDGAPRIKVLDFGIAKLVADGQTQANATRSVGTPLYMAPEQLKVGHKLSAASDIYALGMCAYTLMVGKAYWEAEASGDGNVFAFAAVVAQGPKEKASARAAKAGVKLPPGFDAWFEKVTAVDPAGRFRTATATIAALAQAVGVPVPAAATVSRLPSDSTPSLRVISVSGATAGAATVTQSPLARPRSKPGAALVAGGIALLGLALGGYALRDRIGGRAPSPATPDTQAAVEPAAPPPPAASTAAAPSPPAASAATVTAPPASSAASPAPSTVAAALPVATKPPPGGKLPKPPAAGKPPPPATPPAAPPPAPPPAAPTYSRD